MPERSPVSASRTTHLLMQLSCLAMARAVHMCHARRNGARFCRCDYVWTIQTRDMADAAV